MYNFKLVLKQKVLMAKFSDFYLSAENLIAFIYR